MQCPQYLGHPASIFTNSVHETPIVHVLVKVPVLIQPRLKFRQRTISLLNFFL